MDKYLESDNCKSPSEFIEKATLFYLGYLRGVDNSDYLAPIVLRAIDSAVSGAEQRLSRNVFKIAVELGILTNIIAAKNTVSEETRTKLRSMVTDEIKHINGIISFEEAYKYQKE